MADEKPRPNGHFPVQESESESDLRKSISSNDCIRRTPSKGASVSASDSQKGWNPDTKIVRAKPEKLRKGESMDQRKDKPFSAKKLLNKVTCSSDARSPLPQKSRASSSGFKSPRENGKPEVKSSPNLNKPYVSNQRLKEKDNEIRKLKSQVNDTKKIQEENKRLQEELTEARKLLEVRDRLIISQSEQEVKNDGDEKMILLQQDLAETKKLLAEKDGQLKEAEIKLQVYADLKNAFNSEEIKKLSERIKSLEDEFHQTVLSQSKHEKKFIKDVLTEQMTEMKEHINKLAHPKGPSNVYNGNKENGLLPKRRKSAKKQNVCWRNHQNCLLTTQQFQSVADRLGNDWKQILRLLEVKEYRIENIEVNYENSSAAEKAVQGLVSWQRQTPKQASRCTLYDVLKKADRNDIITHLNSPPTDDDFSDHEIFIESVDHYVGREEEIKTIREFCGKFEGPRLLYINGLPGIGKSEVLNNALSRIDRKRVIQPNFYAREDRFASWTYEEFMLYLTKAWKVAFGKEVHNMREELIDMKEEILLILQLGALFGEPIVAHNIWRFIYDITKSNSSKLKVIVTTCKHPEEILICKVPVHQIALRGLDRTFSLKLLQQLCPNINENQGRELYRFVGGNPFLLLKLSANIKAFANFKDDMQELITAITHDSEKLEYVRRLVKRTEWSEKMVEVIDQMDDNERVVLAKLSVFKGAIPKCLLTIIYGDNETRHEADHFFTYHCILEYIRNGKAYRLAPIYRVFIRMYVQEDKNLYCTDDGDKMLQSIWEDARKRVVKCYNEILVSLTEMFFSKENPDNIDECCARLVREYREGCEICLDYGECRCSNFIISRALFRAHKTMLIKSLELHYDHYGGNFTYLSPVNVFIFLKYMSDCLSLKFQPFEDRERQSFAEHGSVFLFYYRFLLKATCEGRVLPLQFLDKGISTLQTDRGDGSSYQLVMYFLHLARAALLSTMEGKELNFKVDVTRARELLYLSMEDLKNKNVACSLKDKVKRFSASGLETDELNNKELYSLPNNLSCNAKYHYIDILADITHRLGQYENAKKLWINHLSLAYEQFGEDHPFTAKSFYLLGKCQEKLAEHPSLVIGSYQKAICIYTNLGLEKNVSEVTVAYDDMKEKFPDVEIT